MVHSLASSPDKQAADLVDPISPIARLSAGQLECMVLVSQHLRSKEIAKLLGISRHTVDQRVRGALGKLGVDDRQKAAQLVAAALSPQGEAYQRLIHQPSYIDADAEIEQQESAVGNQIRHTDRAGEVEPPGVNTEQRPIGFGAPLQLPFATRSHPSNEMSVGLRLLWIFLIAIGAAFSAGMYLAGLESLSRLIGS